MARRVCTRVASAFGVLLMLCGPMIASAQQPRRLPLERGADTNDWRAYYDYGFKQLTIRPSRSDSAFYWASRLAPNRAEPLFGRWVAFWLRNQSIFFDYLMDRTPREEVSHVAHADSFLNEALWRNPLLVRTLELQIYDRLRLGREWSEDEWTQGWLAFGHGHPERASELWGRLLRRNADRRAWIRYDRAIVFAALQRYDSAIGDLQALVAVFNRLHRDSLVRVIDRKEFLYYGIGLLWLAVPNLDSATTAFQEALLQDLSYAPAHEGLAEIAEARGDQASATREFRLAIDLVPGDVWYRDRLGVILGQAGHLEEAAAQLDTVTQQEPLFSEGFYQLGLVLDAAGRHEGAAAAYHHYLALAARAEEGRIRNVQQRLANLEVTH